MVCGQSIDKLKPVFMILGDRVYFSNELGTRHPFWTKYGHISMMMRRRIPQGPGVIYFLEYVVNDAKPQYFATTIIRQLFPKVHESFK